MKIEKIDGCTVSDIMVDGESFVDCSDTKWGILKQRLIGYLTERVQSDEDLQDLLSWACDMYGITRHETTASSVETMSIQQHWSYESI